MLSVPSYAVNLRLSGCPLGYFSLNLFIATLFFNIWNTFGQLDAQADKTVQPLTATFN